MHRFAPALLISICLVAIEAKEWDPPPPPKVMGRPAHGLVPNPVTEEVAIEAKKWNPPPPLMVMGRPAHGLVPSPVTEEQKIRSDQQPLWSSFYQTLDHFNPADNRTFIQYYFYNMNYYKGSEIVFLMVGGESPLDGWWTTAVGIPFTIWAQKFGAAIFNLEHRFYGYSRPFPYQTTDNLKYLSSRQAIEDLATFIRYTNSWMKLKNPKWILFGGSYPASLAVWFREKHPELAVGAVGSSAPIQAQYDFHQYLEVVQFALRRYSAECADAVGKGVEEMARLMWTENGRTTLSDIFNLSPRLDRWGLRYNDIQYFFFVIQSNFQTTVQYSWDNDATHYKYDNINDVCWFMDNTNRTYVERLADVNKYVHEVQQGGQFSKTYDSYDDFITFVQDVNYYGDGSSAATRSWVWQTCSEFGFMQSTDQGRNIFGSQTPNNLYINWCTDIFGPAYVAQTIESRVHSTNNFYGGNRNYTGSNAVFINGNIDPWHPLSLYSSKNPTVVSYLIDGTAHCADMYAPRPDDAPGLAIAHNITEQNIARWLSEEIKTTKPTVATTTTSKPTVATTKTPKPTVATTKTPKPTVATTKTPKPTVATTKTPKPTVATTKTPKSIVAAPKSSITNIISDKKLSKREAVFPPMEDFVSQINIVPLRPFSEAMEEIRSRSSPQKGPKFFLGRPNEGFLPHPPIPDQLADYPPGFYSGNITALVNNFDPLKNATFHQRFWYNPQYYRNGGPFFLFICGESPADIGWLLNPDVPMMANARKYGAGVFMLEHRYYGLSRPTPNQSTENLKYLSMQQAILDLVRFIRYFNWRWQLKNPKWITFGGSYPGTLSAWIRQFYPDLVAGAFASSAPIEAKVDFYGYELQCQNSIRMFDENCASNIGFAFNNMHLWSLTAAGHQSLSQTFSLQPSWDNTTNITDKDMQYFFDSLIAMLDGNVQYNGIVPGGIRKICQFMNNNQLTPMQNLAALVRYISGYNVTDNSYQSLVDWLRYDAFEYSSTYRTWLYQTCSQFGYFQSTDIGKNIFGSPVPVNYFIELCSDVFGPEFTSKSIYNAVEDLQLLTGGRDRYWGTNVLFTNGNVDPWHLLGKYNGTGGITTYLIDGAAHCADMMPPRPDDVPGLRHARDLLTQKIAEWLGIPATTSSTTTLSTSTPVKTSTARTTSTTSATSTTSRRHTQTFTTPKPTSRVTSKHSSSSTLISSTRITAKPPPTTTAVPTTNHHHPTTTLSPTVKQTTTTTHSSSPKNPPHKTTASSEIPKTSATTTTPKNPPHKTTASSEIPKTSAATTTPKNPPHKTTTNSKSPKTSATTTTATSTTSSGNQPAHSILILVALFLVSSLNMEQFSM